MSESKTPSLEAESLAVEAAAAADLGLILRRPLPDNHPAYSLIGRVAAEWARLEHILDTIIWELAGLEPAFG